MGLNYNNYVDQDLMPNQASVGPNYQAPMDGAPPGGNTVIHRKGVITRLDLSGNLTASRSAQFGTKAAEGWADGDTVYIQLPKHGGAGFTFDILDINGNVLCTWAALVANGGMFVFGASTIESEDFGAVSPGDDVGGGGGSGFWIDGTQPGPLLGGTNDGSAIELQAGGLSIAPAQSPPDASAALDVQSPDKGILIPRLTGADVAAIVTPAESLLVYVTDDVTPPFVPGYWFNSGTPGAPAWAPLNSVSMTAGEQAALANPPTGLVVYNTTLLQLQYWNGAAWVALVASGGGGVGDSAMFYGLTAGTGNGGPTDYPATIAAGVAVPFPRLGPAVGTSITALTASTFQLAAIGKYKVDFRVQTAENAQIELRLNGALLPETCFGDQDPTAGGHPIGGTVLIETAAVNEVLEVVNPTGNTTAFTIVPADGAQTHANAQVLTITRIG